VLLRTEVQTWLITGGDGEFQSSAACSSLTALENNRDVSDFVCVNFALRESQKLARTYKPRSALASKPCQSLSGGGL